MATSITTSAGSGASSGSPGWSNPSNITASDNVYATCSVDSNNTSTGYLIAYNFGFNIPSGATINGIQVSIEAHASTSNATYIGDIELGTWNGSTFTTKGVAKSNANYLTLSDAIYTAGSSSDLWGASWSYSDFNSSQFGCRIKVYYSGGAVASAIPVYNIGAPISTTNSSTDGSTGAINIYVDYISITITYSTGGTTQQLTATISMNTTFTPKISITKRLESSISSATFLGGSLRKIAGLRASVNGSSVLSPFLSIYKKLSSVISGSTQISPFMSVKKALRAIIQSSTSFIADLAIRGRVFLNAIISASTSFVGNLQVKRKLVSTISGKTQISPFVSVKRSLKGSIVGQTSVSGKMSIIKKLVSKITTQTNLNAKLVATRGLSAITSGKTTLASNLQLLKGLASQIVGKTKFEALLIRIRLLRAVFNSSTQVSAFMRRVVKMFASFIGSTTFIAVPTFWTKVKKSTAAWRQKDGEVKTWKRIK